MFLVLGNQPFVPKRKRCVFSRDMNIFCQEVFQIVFVSRGGAFLEYYRVFTGMLTVDRIRKHLWGLTLSNILPLALTLREIRPLIT